MLDFVRLAAGAIVLFLLPGYALLAIGRRHLALDCVEALCMALGLSLAAVPLFLYATTLLGVRQGPEMVWALLGLCVLVVAWDWWSTRGAPVINDERDAQRKWIYAGLGIVLLFTLVDRLWSVRGIEFPFWTDSYGHAVITQLVVDQGMVPATYEPYAPIHDFTYHFGFHALTAWYHWITGASVLHSMVIVGQLLNVLVVPTTYLFVQRFFNSRVAGLVAAVVVGVVSHMPVQFINWGRHTQLDGQMLLPIVMVLFLALLQTPAPRGGLLLLTAAAFVGLFFAHYRIFIFGALLAAILWGWAMLRPAKGHSRRSLLRDALLLTLLGLLLLAPWLWRLAHGFGGSYATVVVNGYEAQQHGNYYSFDPKELLDFGMHGYLWALAAIGALWGLWRGNKMVIVLLLWMIATFAGANLHYLDFTPLYSNTIVIISLYLPLSALIGYLGDEVANIVSGGVVLTPAARTRWMIGLMGVLMLLGGYAVIRNQRIVERDNIFVRAGDIQAMQWIERETSADALFYIATTFWTPEVAHGLDGGYYLPLLAARQTIMPPQHYASDGSGEYRNFVNQRLFDLAASAQDADALWEVLNRYGISHIYIGVRKTQLVPEFFLARPDLFTPLYEQEGVWIFAVNPRTA